MTTDTLRARLDRQMSEVQFQAQVIEYAHLTGWLCAHFRPARTARGWVTPVTADGSGFPDLVLVRERVVVAELKSETGRPTAEQRRWLDALEAAKCEWYLWRPSSWPEVERVLS